MISNNEIKHIHSLKLKKYREANGQFVAEGPKIITELAAMPHAKEAKVYALASWAEAHQAMFGGKIVVVTEAELNRMSHMQAPQQVLAVLPTWHHHFSGIAPQHWSLALDGIQDPGNMGTLLRIADWFGIKQIFCTNDTADIFNNKVAQASMGSLFRVQVFYGPLHEWLTTATVPVYGMMLSGTDVTLIDEPTAGIVVAGNEGRGIRPEVSKTITQNITIVRHGQAESLNAAVATGIVLSHLIKNTSSSI
jgi:TrmH family RNA methyltransferase